MKTYGYYKGIATCRIVFYNHILVLVHVANLNFCCFFCRRFTSNVLKHIASRAFDNVNMCYMYVYLLTFNKI